MISNTVQLFIFIVMSDKFSRYTGHGEVHNKIGLDLEWLK